MATVDKGSMEEVLYGTMVGKTLAAAEDRARQGRVEGRDRSAETTARAVQANNSLGDQQISQKIVTVVPR